MSSNIEIEAKVLLNQEEYEKIIDVLSLEKYRKVKQINYYIDTKDRFLKKNGIALRVREKDDFELTLKTPLSEGLLEKSESITWRDFELLQDKNIFPEGNIKNFLSILGVKINELTILTCLQTERIDFQYKGGKISLDKNTYSGVIDYELEIEHTSMDKAQALTEEVLKECGIEKKPQNHISKQARALNILNK
ncbi:MAG: CYTH domain-containing protein [Bacilli bacterium]